MVTINNAQHSTRCMCVLMKPHVPVITLLEVVLISVPVSTKESSPLGVSMVETSVCTTCIISLSLLVWRV